VAQYNGGGVYNDGQLQLNSNSGINQNLSMENGGGLWNSGTVTLNNSTVSGNALSHSAAMGGGIYNSASLSLTNAIISGNTGGYGGGIYNASAGQVTGTNSQFQNNTATYEGGAVFNRGQFQLQGRYLGHNVAGDAGGAVWNSGTLQLTDSTISGNPSRRATPEAAPSIIQAVSISPIVRFSTTPRSGRRRLQ